jgi:hypothetical protein
MDINEELQQFIKIQDWNKIEQLGTPAIILLGNLINHHIAGFDERKYIHNIINIFSKIGDETAIPFIIQAFETNLSWLKNSYVSRNFDIAKSIHNAIISILGRSGDKVPQSVLEKIINIPDLTHRVGTNRSLNLMDDSTQYDYNQTVDYSFAEIRELGTKMFRACQERITNQLSGQQSDNS